MNTMRMREWRKFKKNWETNRKMIYYDVGQKLVSMSWKNFNQYWLEKYPEATSTKKILDNISKQISHTNVGHKTLVDVSKKHHQPTLANKTLVNIDWKMASTKKYSWLESTKKKSCSRRDETIVSTDINCRKKNWTK